MKFKIGDKVSFLNDKGSGMVSNIVNNFRVLVTNEDGFEVPVSIGEIVPFADRSEYKMDEKVKAKWIDEKEDEEVHPPKLERDEVWEVDLHLHDLTDTGRFRGDHEKLLYQVKYFKK